MARLYESIKPRVKKCYHGISMNKHCLGCLDYQIERKYTEIKSLKQMRRIIVKEKLA